MYLRLALPAVLSLTASAMAQPQNGGPQLMSLIDVEQKSAVEKSIGELRAARSASEYAGNNKATAKLVRNQQSVASVRGFSVVQDEPASVAGGATGPTPTDYFMVALGSCQNVVFVRFAALADVAIDSLETVVTGTWDRRGLYGIADTDPGFQQITIETTVSTAAAADKVADAIRRTQRACPIFATLRRETRLTVRLVVNGRDVPL